MLTEGERRFSPLPGEGEEARRRIEEANSLAVPQGTESEIDAALGELRENPVRSREETIPERLAREERERREIN